MRINFPTGRTLGALYLATGLFASSAVLALWVPQSTVREVMAELAQLFSPLKERSLIFLAAVIFLNNAFKAFFVILSGWLLGVGPVVFLVINGLVLGLAVRMAVVEYGARGAIVGLLPHGVIEIPAIILAAALGLQVAGQVLRRLRGRPSLIKAEFKHSLLILAYLILPALLLAALVEAFITSRLMGLLLSSV